MTPRSLLLSPRRFGQAALHTQSDERLLDLAGAGSEPAFEAIVGRYRHPLLRYCTGLLGESRGEDCVQETFVKAHAAIHRGDAVRTLRPWLYRIAHNTAANGLRDSPPHHEPLDESAASDERPDLAAERGQELRRALAAVQGLPRRQRDVILLRALDGHSYDEIAAHLGLSNGAVRQLLCRARTSLRAGMTAVTPMGAILRLLGPAGDAPLAARVAEACGGAGAGAVAAKLCVTVVATGTIAGGAAQLPPESVRAQARVADSSSAGRQAAVRSVPASGSVRASSSPVASVSTPATSQATAVATEVPVKSGTGLTKIEVSAGGSDREESGPRAHEPRDRHPGPPDDDRGRPSQPPVEHHEDSAASAGAPSEGHRDAPPTGPTPPPGQPGTGERELSPSSGSQGRTRTPTHRRP